MGRMVEERGTSTVVGLAEGGQEALALFAMMFTVN